MPSSISMIVTPVVVSPSTMAVDTGDGPRSFGRSEGWTFRHEWVGRSSTSLGRKSPYAATTIRSGASAPISRWTSSDFSDGGWRTGSPIADAAALTGVGEVFFPLPDGLSGLL